RRRNLPAWARSRARTLVVRCRNCCRLAHLLPGESENEGHQQVSVLWTVRVAPHRLRRHGLVLELHDRGYKHTPRDRQQCGWPNSSGAYIMSSALSTGEAPKHHQHRSPESAVPVAGVGSDAIPVAFHAQQYQAVPCIQTCSGPTMGTTTFTSNQREEWLRGM
ncbi:unnamed protein product, partial [Ectocarpus sp. 12 AP-2014]